MNPTTRRGQRLLNKHLLDVYTDYLLTSFSRVTATGVSKMLDNHDSHDQITRFLAKGPDRQKQYWLSIKPRVRQFEQETGVLIVDDTLEEKPYTDENEMIGWHDDHTTGKHVKGINIVNFLSQRTLKSGQDLALPLADEVVAKTEEYSDPNTQQPKRQRSISKNEMGRHRLRIRRFHNRIQFHYVVFDRWFSSKENLQFVKQELKKQFVWALQANRTVALAVQDTLAGKFRQVTEMDITPPEARLGYVQGLDFPVVLATQVFTNKDGSTGVLYRVSNDTDLTYDHLTAIYQQRWNVEEFHKSLKQNVALEQSPTRPVTTPKNHIFAAMFAFITLERLKLNSKLNHVAWKNHLSIKAIQTCFKELKSLQQQFHLSSYSCVT